MSVIASDFHHPQCLRLVHVLARDLAVVNVEISRINLHVLSAGFTARVSDSVDYWAMLHCSHQPGQIRKMDRPSLVNLPDNVFWDTSTRCNSDIPQLWTGWQSPPTQRNLSTLHQKRTRVWFEFPEEIPLGYEIMMQMLLENAKIKIFYRGTWF